MFRKMAFVVVVVTCGLTACVGPNGKGEGDSCTTEDSCGSDLQCQPIPGHGDVCCPTPPDASSKSSCQAESDGG